MEPITWPPVILPVGVAHPILRLVWGPWFEEVRLDPRTRQVRILSIEPVEKCQSPIEKLLQNNILWCKITGAWRVPWFGVISLALLRTYVVCSWNSVPQMLGAFLRSCVPSLALPNLGETGKKKFRSAGTQERKNALNCENNNVCCWCLDDERVRERVLTAREVYLQLIIRYTVHFNIWVIM